MALSACLCLAAFTAAAERRVALVIGNDKYVYLPKLNNAGKDARDMAAKLRGLGFEVIASYNASQRKMGRAIAKFSSRLSAGGTGLVYYAGHGVQARGRNYLIPVNSELVDETDLKYGAIDTRDILAAMRDAGNPLNILIMDACRDNPLPKRTRSSSRGLAISSVPKGAKGTAIIYAAGPGQTAADGTAGGNSVFTGALLKHMGKPGWTLQKVLQTTSQEVLRRTNNKQRPWQLVSMQGEFRFKEAGRPQVVPPRQTVGNNNQAEVLFWQSVKDSSDASVYQAYLEQYPSGTYSTLARIRIAKLEKADAQKAANQARKDQAARRQEKAAAIRSRQWAGLKDSQDVGKLNAFIRQHSGSPEAQVAQQKLAMLTPKPKQKSKLKFPDGIWILEVDKNGCASKIELKNGAYSGWLEGCYTLGDSASQRGINLKIDRRTGKVSGVLYAGSEIVTYTLSGTPDKFIGVSSSWGSYEYRMRLRPVK